MTPPFDPRATAGLKRPGQCSACGAVAAPEARFCGECGATLPRRCPACALPVGPGQRFCTACGTSLDQAAAIPGAAAPQDGGAERRFMTLLFCDLVGSSRLAARLDPEDFAALLVAYRERCAAAVVQNGGWMSGYSGDGVIACFGYPRAMGREAQAAVNCALAIAQEVSALAGATRLPGGSELAVRIGIETGLVVAGRLGPAAAMEVDAFVGTVPNTAARLQGLAEPNGVVIGEATHELVHHEFDCEELPAERLVHLQPPVRAFAVRGEAKRRGRRLVLNRRDVPLIGRSAPLGLLRERWARAAEGQGQTVLLSGEAGIGKSRLAQELVDHITAAPHA